MKLIIMILFVFISLFAENRDCDDKFASFLFLKNGNDYKTLDVVNCNDCPLEYFNKYFSRFEQYSNKTTTLINNSDTTPNIDTSSMIYTRFFKNKEPFTTLLIVE